MAILWAMFTGWQASQVATVNTSRVVAMAFGGGAILDDPEDEGSPPKSPSETSLPADEESEEPDEDTDSSGGPVRSSMFPGLNLDTSAQREAREARLRLQRQVGTTEVIVYIWKRVMLGLAVVIGALGAIGLLTRFVRGPHLLAAGLMLAAMAGTIYGMRLLQSPDGGGLPQLSTWSYLIVALTMSAYASVLIALYARKFRPVA